MSKATGPERRSTSMKSLLARIESEGQPAERAPHRKDEPRAGERLGERTVPERRAEWPLQPMHELDNDGANVLQTRIRRQAPMLPTLGRESERAIDRLPLPDDPDQQRFFRTPVLIGIGAIASTLFALPLFFWLVLPWLEKGRKPPAVAAPERAIVRPVETQVITAEVAAPTPARTPAQPVPQIAQPPEPRARLAPAPVLAPAPTPEPVATAAVAVPEPKVEPPPQPVVAALAAVPMPTQPAMIAPIVPPQTPRLVVDAALAVRGGARVPLPIKIQPPDAISQVGRIVLRGLPPTVVVPQASRGPAGSLIITPDALATTVLDLTAAKPGETDVEIELQGRDNTVLDRTTTMLAIVPATAPREAPPARAEALLSKGRSLFTSGDIAGARLILERAVEVGSAPAALALGETFDPAALAARGVRGMTPDVRQARTWYERARTLGVAEADERLRRLPQQ